MKRRIPVIHFVLIVLLTVPTVSWSRSANDSNHDWALLMAIQPGEVLVVKMKDGKKHRGALIRASEELIVLSRDNQTTDLSRQDIYTIRLKPGRSLKKPILIGTLVGTGVGIALGAAVAADDGSWLDFKASETIPVGAVVGAVVGTIIGLVVGLFPRQGDIVYQAR